MQLEALLQLMAQQNPTPKTEEQSATPLASMAKTGTGKCDGVVWIIDSGASDHMTKNKNLLSKFRLFSEPKRVMIANGLYMIAMGYDKLNKQPMVKRCFIYSQPWI